MNEELLDLIVTCLCKIFLVSHQNYVWQNVETGQDQLGNWYLQPTNWCNAMFHDMNSIINVMHHCNDTVMLSLIANDGCEEHHDL